MFTSSQSLDDLMPWTLPDAFRPHEAAISYDGQVYFRCHHCDTEIRVAPVFASVHPEACYNCKRGRPELVVHLATCAGSCEDCGMAFDIQSNGTKPLECQRCGSRRLIVRTRKMAPPFPTQFYEGFGWPEYLAAPEQYEEIANRPRHLWGVSAYEDATRLRSELDTHTRLAFTHVVSDYRIWAVRFCRRLRKVGTYQVGAGCLLNFEGIELHDCFRENGDPALGVESVLLANETIAALVDSPINRALEEQNLADRTFSLLRVFGDHLVTLLMERPGARSSAIRAAERALHFFADGDGRQIKGAHWQVTTIHWSLGNLLSVPADDTAYLKRAAKLFPEVEEAITLLGHMGLLEPNEGPSNEDLERAVRYFSSAIDSGLLQPASVYSLKNSRAGAILSMKRPSNELRQLAISDLETIVQGPEGYGVHGWEHAHLNLANLHRDGGHSEKACPLLERACSRAAQEMRRAQNEREVHAHAKRFVLLFDTMARTYADLNRPLDAFATAEILSAVSIRFHTMARDERAAALAASDAQRTKDALRTLYGSLGGTTTAATQSFSEVPSFSEVLRPVHEQIKVAGGRLPGETIGFVSFSTWVNGVLAIVARMKKTGDLEVRAVTWKSDALKDLALAWHVSRSPGAWREKRLQALCDVSYRALWEPLRDTIQELELNRLVISGGPLDGIPFESLIARDTSTTIRSISYLPSIRLVGDLQPPVAHSKCSRRLLVVPYAASDLPYTAEEVDFLQTLSGWSVKVLPNTRTSRRDVLLELANEWDFVHFTCHGSYDEEDPWNSALHLLPDPERDSHRVTARDLLQVRFKGSPVVVLSACSSALTSGDPVKDAAGLTGAFLRAGARGIVAARWPVYDDTALAFMKVLYEAIRDGTTASSAVHSAQQHLRITNGIEDWAAFRYGGVPEL